VGAWAASPAWAGGLSFANQSLRLIVNPTLGGRRVRVRLSNRFGSRPVTFTSATIGRRRAGTELIAGTVRALRFRGRRQVTIAPGAEAVSDAVALRFGYFHDLAVSLHVSGASGPASEHHFASQTSYASAPGAGDHTADTAGDAFTARFTTWPYLTDVEVRAPRRIGAVVALGSSITDGVLSSPDINRRYPDVLARRLAAARAGGPRLAVQNAGLGSNRVLPGHSEPWAGPPAIDRLRTDVLDQAGVSDVIVLEGTNDIGISPTATPEAVMTGLRTIIRRLQARGLNAILGTDTPSKGPTLGLHGSPQAVAARNRINDWVRTSGVADGVVDFNAATRDPADPDRLLPAYDGGDRLHLNDEGYRAMADAVPLELLRGPACANPIALDVRPRRAWAGASTRFTFRATVGGETSRRPLAGVRIRFAGRTARTRPRGKAVMRARLRRPGRHRARAISPGFAAGHATVRARRRGAGRTPR
jgi:lysophospholipase L1-like esterase